MVKKAKNNYFVIRAQQLKLVKTTPVWAQLPPEYQKAIVELRTKAVMHGATPEIQLAAQRLAVQIKQYIQQRQMQAQGRKSVMYTQNPAPGRKYAPWEIRDTDFVGI